MSSQAFYHGVAILKMGAIYFLFYFLMFSMFLKMLFIKLWGFSILLDLFFTLQPGKLQYQVAVLVILFYKSSEGVFVENLTSSLHSVSIPRNCLLLHPE